MSNLNTKQKIILGIIILCMVIVIGFYGYTTLNENEDINIESNIENGLAELGINNIEPKAEASDNIEKNEITNGYENVDGKIIIHITGSVNKTGILVLPEGSRIADAIDKAGGAKEDADLNEVNLAYILQDGQKIYIPNKGDKAKLESQAYITKESGNKVVVDENKAVNKKVNINTASQSELETLPGVGPSTAIKIIEYRQKNGKFQKVEDLQNIQGIGEAKIKNIKDSIVIK